MLIITELGDRDCGKACSPSNDHTHVNKASLSRDGQFRAEVSMQYIISHPRARETNTVTKALDSLTYYPINSNLI